MSEFDQLLEELETLQKAYGDDADDKKIAAAADDDDEAEHPEPDADNRGGPSDHDEDNEDEDDDDGFEPIGKSFAFELDNGETVEAIDASELVKSLTSRLGQTESLLAKAIDERDSVNGRVLTLLKSQSAEIAGLKAQVAKLSGEGRGRKAVVNVHEAAEPMAKSESNPRAELMAKATAAYEQGRLTGREWVEVDASLRLNQIPSQSILAKLG